MNTMDLLAQMAWRGTLVLALGFAVAYGFGRASAAFRHYLWTTVFCVLLALPAAMVLAPKWSMPNMSSVSSAPAPAMADQPRTTVTVRTPAPATPGRKPMPNPLPSLYAAGIVAVAIRFAAGAVRTRKLLAGGVPTVRLGVPRKVRVIESPQAPVPLVWGILRPVIVLPTASRHWPAERLRTVLLHELIHVQRRDLLAHVVAQVACCLYWFHPLAWIAARELRKERERACDDAVLQRGIAAPEYAGHLIDLVRGLACDTPAMAEASDFEGRVRALLDRGRNRAPLTRRVVLAGAALGCALILPVASITSHAQAARGALAGIVTDPSGARIPGAGVVAKNLDGANEELTTADSAGEFLFPAIPAGRYEIRVNTRGFKVGKTEAIVVAGAAARADTALEVGEATEVVTVMGGKTSAPRVQAKAAAPQRIPIGGNVQMMRLLSQVKPVYPAELQQQGITASVVMRGIVSKTGQLTSLRVMNSADPLFAKAAMEAAQQWQYQPALLNGMPIEILTTIQINFELDK